MRTLAVCLALCLLAGACKKSVKGEAQRWKSANRTVDELIVHYPGFKAALEDQRARAKVAMDAAEKVEDKKQRIKQMSAANHMITGGFIGQLDSARQTTTRIRDQLIEVAGMGKDPAAQAKARAASEEARRILADVESTLKKGAPNAGTAELTMRKVSGDLRRAEQILDRIVRANRDTQTADTEGTADPGTGAAKPAPPQPATWTCDHCDHQNSGDQQTCNNCGAPRPAAAP